MANIEAKESDSPIIEFEKAFDNVIAGFISIEQCRVVDSTEARHSAERAVTILVEAARKLDIWFIQRRFLLSQQKPQYFVQEEIEEMRAKLIRKETLIQEVRQHIKDWNSQLQTTLTQIQPNNANSQNTS